MASPTEPDALAAEERTDSVAQSVRTIKAYLDQLKRTLPATGVCYADIGLQHFDDFLVMLDRGEDCIRRVYAPAYAPEHVPKRARCAAPAPALERSEQPGSSGSALDDVLKVAVAGAMSEA